MDSSELIQVLVSATTTLTQRMLNQMTDEQKEKREQAILACTKAVYDIDPNEVFCNITIDISCWPPTRAGHTAEIQCLDHPWTNPKFKAYRQCSVNGTWSKLSYKSCRKTEKTVVKMWFDYGYPIICVALLIALAMLFYFKTLRCLRNYIHCNLMLAMLISNTNYILFSYFGMNFARQNPDGCKAVGLYLIYFNTAINFWMFVEGFYLLTVVLWTYRAHKIRLWYFLLFGWGTPLVVTSIYAVLMALYDTENLCWLPRNMKASELTIYSIFVISLSILLSINFFIVIYVVWTLCHKLRGNTTVEIQQVRKATRAIIVLLPILGVHFLVTYLFEFVSPALEIYLFYITNGLQASQGIMVPLLYCFLNGEVHTAIRQKWAVFQEHRSLKASLSHNLSGKKSGHSGIRSSFDNKDISPTLNDKTEIAQLSMTPTGMRQTPLAKIESSV